MTPSPFNYSLKNLTFFIVCGLQIGCFFSLSLIQADVAPRPISKTTQLAATTPFESFTGRIRRNKVRLRTAADVQSTIVSELPQGLLIAVVGEKDDFYAVQTREMIKVYLYKTYVLNGSVDASSVNLRLAPSLEAPIIGQLHQGERIEGALSKEDDKWLEIDLPKNIPLYISKEFIENAGPPSYLATMQKRHEEAEEMVRLAHLSAQNALQDPKQNRDLSAAYRYLQRVATEYQDCPDLIARAEQLRATLEQQSKNLPPLEERPQPMPPCLTTSIPRSMPESMASWIPREQALFEEWRLQHAGQDITAFYEMQRTTAVPLQGIVQPYTRLVRNRPGNFLLIEPVDNYPIAFLYSTEVDLAQRVGENVQLMGVTRPNHHFAFPAFFILSIE